MANNELQNKMAQAKELRRMAAEATAEAEKLENEIKAEMTARNVSELIAGPFKAIYKAITRAQIDSKALRAELPDIAARYTKQTQYMRFTLS